jgi:hypothetical protein
MTVSGFHMSRTAPICLPRTSQRNVVAVPLFNPFRRSAAAIVIPAKRGVDAGHVVHEAYSCQAQASLPSPCLIGDR